MRQQQIVVNIIARGRCVIPVENIKQYGKVIKRLVKDGIDYSERLEDNAQWLELYTERLHPGWIYTRPRNGPCIVIEYEQAQS